MDKLFAINYNIYAIDQFKRHPDGSGDLTCALCPEYRWIETNIYPSPPGYSSVHRNSKAHQDHLTLANAAAKSFFERSLQVHKLLVECEGLGAKHDHLRLQMLSFLYQEPDACSYESLESQLQLFKWQLTLMLLELAVWKYACIMTPPTLVTSITNALFWVASDGWKKNKAAAHCHKMIAVVMENVIPFLDRPTPKLLNH
jgi:hypothetical protein